MSSWWETHRMQGPRWRSFSSVQSLSRVWLFVTPWTAARQASLSFTNSCNLLKPMSIELVMPSSHLILCCPLLLPPSIFPASGPFPMSQFFTSGGQSIGASASASALPMNVQDWSPLGCERLLLNHERRQDSWPPEEKYSIWGQRWDLITQSFCVVKFY